ncbi:MAG: DUF58 domain-containing protein [Phycisphaerales bacterium]
MTHQPDIIDSPFDLGARRFELVVRRLADDLTYGSDASRFVGPGTDYAQSRPYVVGDSIRSIDWKVTARTGRHHAKDYEAPKRMSVHIVLDTSASMGISSGRLSKHAAAVWIAAAIALVAFRRRSPVSVISGGDREVVLPPTLNRTQLWRMIEDMRTPGLSESTRLAERIGRVEELADRTSLVIVISDLHAPEAVDAIKRCGRKHDCLVLQLVDPAEYGGLRAGFIRSVEAETSRSMFVAGGTRFFALRGHEDAWPDACRRELLEAGIDHAVLRTDEPIIPPLRRMLSLRGGWGRIAR